MLYTEYIKINALSVHRIGNKSAVEGIELSKSPIFVDETLNDILKAYFMKAFKDEERYMFIHPTSIDLNAIYLHVTAIFENEDLFHKEGINIAKYLYDKSEHPNIKSGDLYVVHFKDCILDGETVDAIGLFKSENKDTYIQIKSIAGGFDIIGQKGMNLNKIDKGCLIFNLNRKNGYIVCVVDNSNRNDAKYWVKDFLQLKRCEDDFRQTEQIVTMCKGFISKLPEEYDKATKAVMMNNVITTLKEESVSIKNVLENAFDPVGVGDSFMSYANDFQIEEDISFNKPFHGKAESINKRSVKAITRIRLDNNFEITIHGNEENIEKGYDKTKGKRYYTLYFDEEK